MPASARMRGHASLHHPAGSRGHNSAENNLSPAANPPLCRSRMLAEGRFSMRRRDGGAGRRRDRRTGPQIRQPAPGNSGPRAGAAPARRLATGTRAASGLRPEALRPPARSWLTIGGQAAPSDESAARRRNENAAAERRKARRSASWAGDLRRSGDRSARETDHRVRRSAPAPVGALLPSLFERSGNRRRGARAPFERAAERWLG